MNIFQRLKYEDTLTTSERQFATFIEKHTDMVLNGNLRDVVKAAYVSKSMILRFCKKLGLTGFKELKVRLAQDQRLSPNTVDTNFPFNEKDSQKAVAHKLQQLYIDTIKDTVASLQMDTLWEIVLRLQKANHIAIFAQAQNSSLAENFQLRLMSLGYQISFNESEYKQRCQALMTDRDSVALILSYSGQIGFLSDLLKIFHERQVTTIWIGRAGNPRLAKATDYQLYISDKENLLHRIAQFASNLAMQYTLDLLYSCLFKADYPQNLQYIRDNLPYLDTRNLK